MATSSANSCIYYDYVLTKQIPCFIVPGTIYNLKDNEKYCKVIYDTNNFTTGSFNVSVNEVIRYSSDTQRIIDMYPYITTDQQTYAEACIPNLISNQDTFEDDELARMYTLITMLVNTETLQPNFFYTLCDFISYDILFTYLTDTEREFMAEISNVSIIGSPKPEPLPIEDILNICQEVFTAFPEDNTQIYYIQNIRNLVEFSIKYTFPIPLYIPILKANVAYLTSP